MSSEPLTVDILQSRAEEERNARRLIIAVLAITFGRLAINIARRFPYPFVGTIATQLHVSVGEIQTVLAVQGAMGLSSIFFAPVSEIFGRKKVMLAILAIMTITATLVILFPNFWIYALVMLIIGVGKYNYDPAMQAYVGDNVPYHRRGLAIGTLELSWAVSLIIAAPVVATLLATSQAPVQNIALLEMVNYLPMDILSDAGGIRLTFIMISAVLGASVVIMWRFVPPSPPTSAPGKKHPNVIEMFHSVRQHPAAIAAVFFSFALQASNEVFLINYGLWMENSFGLLLTALGVATLVIAAAEICGEFAVMGLSDRIGKRRMTLAGASIAGLCYVLVPLLAPTLTWGLIGLFIMFICLEVGIVSAIALYTEVVPDLRSVMLSSTVAAGAAGRMVGGVIGGIIYSLTGDFIFIGGVAAVIALTACFALFRYVAAD